jgi:hypothetical protein
MRQKSGLCVPSWFQSGTGVGFRDEKARPELPAAGWNAANSAGCQRRHPANGDSAGIGAQKGAYGWRSQTTRWTQKEKNEEQSQISTFLFGMSGLIGYPSMYSGLNIRFSKSAGSRPCRCIVHLILYPGVKPIGALQEAPVQATGQRRTRAWARARRRAITKSEEQSQLSTFLFGMSNLLGYPSICYGLNIRFSKSKNGGPEGRACTSA